MKLINNGNKTYKFSIYNQNDYVMLVPISHKGELCSWEISATHPNNSVEVFLDPKGHRVKISTDTDTVACTGGVINEVSIDSAEIIKVSN
ncbi:hypothetical protein SAMN05216379_11081 [Nitrosomonas eutropha]|uniref:hypothetical protein n=1 Tax=Nitrosomonas TaxID=914 RepID=UPI00088BE030|nr:MULTISPECIES: hypothetical protein [Nitrosomonas]MXS80732.1 hypothetical protein [Nitrosomonas sp. GH22]SCX16413.1 hypothetical protein SAMN05216379_11081 [Nitrosomonas eutropha]